MWHRLEITLIQSFSRLTESNQPKRNEDWTVRQNLFRFFGNPIHLTILYLYSSSLIF